MFYTYCAQGLGEKMLGPGWIRLEVTISGGSGDHAPPTSESIKFLTFTIILPSEIIRLLRGGKRVNITLSIFNNVGL